jgi:hypothetical protein
VGDRYAFGERREVMVKHLYIFPFRDRFPMSSFFLVSTLITGLPADS